MCGFLNFATIFNFYNVIIYFKESVALYKMHFLQIKLVIL